MYSRDLRSITREHARGPEAPTHDDVLAMVGVLAPFCLWLQHRRPRLFHLHETERCPRPSTGLRRTFFGRCP
ncbi:hypothetical protein CBM2631_P40036 [Cupriavidus taiwanensis]|nr:hypothetical protein CBM2631_P40036 [Cupriavidus taiwanensis]SPA54270.1 hypothetical protein CBM2606_P30040 [Cupriavidus taiwanensis]